MHVVYACGVCMWYMQHLLEEVDALLLAKRTRLVALVGLPFAKQGVARGGVLEEEYGRVDHAARHARAGDAQP